MHNSSVMDRDDIDILWVCLITGGLGSLGGLAAHLRMGGEVTRRAFATAMLNSGLFSLSIGCFVVWKMGFDDLILAIVVSVLAGLGGSALLDFVIGMFKVWVRQKVESDGNDKGNEE